MAGAVEKARRRRMYTRNFCGFRRPEYFFFIIFLTKIQRRKRAWEMSYGRGKTRRLN
jgi:hypothetical protein